VIFFEKILEEFTEPHFGNLRVNVQLNKINIDSLQVEENIKFYFWLNIYGICHMDKAKDIFEQVKYVETQQTNGFKLLTDEKEMMKLILPKIDNQGDKKKENELNSRTKAK
jgi:hypothetical protein